MRIVENMQKKEYPKFRECPFCESENVFLMVTTEIRGESFMEKRRICCRSCHVKVEVDYDYKTFSENIVKDIVAISRWNRRVDDGKSD